MIDRTQLLADLQALLRKLEADLLERSSNVPEVGEVLRSDYEQAKDAERTAQSYEEWRSDAITQMASAWVLSGVFVRFLEDNQLIDPPVIAGLGERLQRSRDEHELYFRQHPQNTDRDYWLMVFDQLAKLPGAREIFGANNRIRELPNWLSGDAAGELLRFFQRVEPGTGRLVHDFTDENWDTRFLGDLYQDLSEAARKKYALLQTPEFVESFILDRTLEPALDEFQLEFQRQEFRMIDPACGSGHFLLGSFQRLLDRWIKKEPATSIGELVLRSLKSIHGVDINPYAVAIARFRLLLAAMKASGIERLRNAPDYKIQVICGDSLLHGEGTQLAIETVLPKNHYYKSEDIAELNRVLIRGHYHAVVANPPYITPKDSAANSVYRKLYKACHMKYSLAIPFMERIFQLAVERGFTGQITANSFMKREFGKKLIEEFFPKVDLTHVIDTSGAYIPGHGTPTVILFGRNRKFIASTIRTVMGIKGEPTTPDNPEQGRVWLAILNQIDQVGSQSEFVSVADSSREQFHKHPWSIGGGGATDLKEWLESNSISLLETHIDSIGFVAITGQDEAFVAPNIFWKRKKVASLEFGVGDVVRDWTIRCDDNVIRIYQTDQNSDSVQPIDEYENLVYALWFFRTNLRNRLMFGKLPEESGLKWYEYRFVSKARLNKSLLIVFAFVSTHNHFVLDRGGRVFKQTAPVIQLLPSATEDDHLELLGLLNSSTSCFWMKQVCQNKGATSDSGVLQADPEKFRFEFDGTKLSQFPIPSFELSFKEKLIALTKALDLRGTELSAITFGDFIANSFAKSSNLKSELQKFLLHREKLKCEMVRLQEELDWLCYEIYGLLPTSSKARSRIWISTVKEFPAMVPDARPYRAVSSERITELDEIDLARTQLIQNNAQIRLVESPEYKRRWFRSAGAYDDTNLDDATLLQRGLLSWLLDRLETYFDFDGRMNKEGNPTSKIDISLVSIAQLADLARHDPEFLQVGELYRKDAAFDVLKLVAELVEAESVPLLPVLRYKPSGLRKHDEWKETWKQQRLEDAIDARTKLPKDHPDHVPESAAKRLKQQEIGDIPVPPKYTSSDFQKSHYWKLRGKLDVPKERWVSFPHCNAEDGTIMIAWAGYNHLQLAQAISTYFITVKEEFGGSNDPRLPPLLANLVELLPWLKQWHNAPDPDYNNLVMSDYFETLMQEQAHGMGKTLDEVSAWQPPAKTGRRRT